MKLNSMVGLLVFLGVIVGCTPQAMESQNMSDELEVLMDDSIIPKRQAIQGEWSEEEMAAMEHEEAVVGFVKYTKERFEQAVAEKKVIVLDFAANWCLDCLREEPELRKGVMELKSPDVIVLKIPYTDSDTLPEHTALAQQYQIAYQHTKVIIKDGAVVLKTPEVWTAGRFVAELQKVL